MQREHTHCCRCFHCFTLPVYTNTHTQPDAAGVGWPQLNLGWVAMLFAVGGCEWTHEDECVVGSPLAAVWPKQRGGTQLL